MNKFTQIFSFSILTLALTACSGGGGGGSGDNGNNPAITSSTDGKTANTATVTNTTTVKNTATASSTTGTTSSDPKSFQIDGSSQTYTLQSALVNQAIDNTYLTPSTTAVQEKDRYKVKSVATASKPTLTEMIEYTNKLRVSKGLNELQVDQTLMAAAQHRAEELVGRYSHIRPDGSRIRTLFNQNVGFGENIAAGQATAQIAMQGFENSSSHYQLMVNQQFTKTGVGFVSVPGSPYTYYWVQLFGTDNVDTNYYFDSTSTAAQNKLTAVSTPTSNSNDQTTWMIIDNFPVYLKSIQPNGNWYSFSKTDGKTTYDGLVNGYSDVRFGLAQLSGHPHNVFYRGNNTKFENMPTTGTATYTGKGIITDGGNSRYLNSAFSADFANKQLNGVLSENGVKVTDIQAIIRGSSFYSPQDATVETQGGFFGTNATELGGVFYDHRSSQYGAFGAKQ